MNKKLIEPIIVGFFKFATIIMQWYLERKNKTKKLQGKTMSSEFEKERDDILLYVEEAITRILLSDDRMLKHAPYTWQEEDVNQHLLKCSRHINTYMQIQQGYQQPDGEMHLNNAICRLSMAVAKIGLAKVQKELKEKK